MGKVVNKIILVIGVIVALPFIVLGIAIGATILIVKAVVKLGAAKEKPITKPVAIKETDKGTITGSIDWNAVPVGRMDKGGTC